MSQEIELLIRNGLVYDGSGAKPFAADIGITGGRIVFISSPSAQDTVKPIRIIEAAGLSVAPGFIDTHSHSDFTLLADNRAQGKILQGVTTEINGNCGLSAAPLFGEALQHREADLKELGIEDRWATFSEYFKLLEGKGLAINFATLVGHGNLRASVLGFEARPPSRKEMQEMCALLKEAVAEGAIGLSTGLVYPPGVYAETEELIELAKGISSLIYTSHMRNEGDTLIEAIEEAISIGRGAGIAVHISHLKTSGMDNWKKIDAAISAIEKARDKRMRVTCDRYPYTAGSTDLDAILPAWTYAGGTEEELKRIKDKETRELIRKEILILHPFDDYWERVVVASVTLEANKWMEGKAMSFISKERDRKPVDMLFDLLIEEALRVGAIFHSMSEENLRRFVSLSYVMIGSDSSARAADGLTHIGKPHPRGFGTFSRFIGRYVRELRLVSLSEAIHKMTMLAAQTFGLKERGQVKTGFMADLVIFDEGKIIDSATFEEPFLKPVGISYVLVNGQPSVWKGAQTEIRSGKILRHGEAA